MPSKRTVDRRASVHEQCRYERQSVVNVLEAVQQENRQLQKLVDEAHARNDELLQRVGDLRDTVKDLGERLRKECTRSGQALDAFESVSVAVNSTGRVVHWLADMVQGADLVLKPREKK